MDSRSKARKAALKAYPVKMSTDGISRYDINRHDREKFAEGYERALRENGILKPLTD